MTYDLQTYDHVYTYMLIRRYQHLLSVFSREEVANHSTKRINAIIFTRHSVNNTYTYSVLSNFPMQFIINYFYNL